jgi:hypothetical protein
MGVPVKPINWLFSKNLVMRSCVSPNWERWHSSKIKQSSYVAGFYFTCKSFRNCSIFWMVVSTNLVLSVNCRTKDCVLSVTSTLSLNALTRSWFGNPNLFYRLQKRLCTRLAIPSQFGLPWTKLRFYPNLWCKCKRCH